MGTANGLKLVTVSMPACLQAPDSIRRQAKDSTRQVAPVVQGDGFALLPDLSLEPIIDKTPKHLLIRVPVTTSLSDGPEVEIIDSEENTDDGVTSPGSLLGHYQLFLHRTHHNSMSVDEFQQRVYANIALDFKDLQTHSAEKHVLINKLYDKLISFVDYTANKVHSTPHPAFFYLLDWLAWARGKLQITPLPHLEDKLYF